VISLTNCYRQSDFGDPIVALKSYVLSPFADESRMDSIVDQCLRRETTWRDSAVTSQNYLRRHLIVLIPDAESAINSSAFSRPSMPLSNLVCLATSWRETSCNARQFRIGR